MDKQSKPYWYSGNNHLALILPSGQTALRLIRTDGLRLDVTPLILENALVALIECGLDECLKSIELLTSAIPLPSGGSQAASYRLELI